MRLELPPDAPWRRAAPGVALALLVLVAYAPALDGKFVWDDDYNVLDKAALGGAKGLARIWIDTRATQQYYPLTHSSFWIEYQLWGENPFGYHLVNVGLHLGSALLFWRVLLRLGVPGAWLAAGLFALHPVHVESVAWITERKNALSGALYLGSALAFLRHALPAHGERRRPRILPALCALLFAAALLAKTVVLTLPVALGLLLVWKHGRPRPAHLAGLAAMLLSGVALGLFTLHLERSMVGARGAEFSLSAAERAILAGRAAWFYLGKLVWPVPLAFSYARWELDAASAGQYAFSAAALTGLAALACLRRRLGGGPLVAALYMLLTLSPVLGPFDFFYMRYAFVADHFLYLASLGPIALAAAAATRAPLGSPPVRRAMSMALLVGLGGLTWHQCTAYKDQETLWRRSLSVEPRSFLAHYNLGELLERQGALDEALSHYEETLRLHPTWVDAWVNRGSVHGKRGEFDRALACLERALALSPGHATAHFNRGLALEMLGRPDEALAAYQQAVRSEPGRIDAHKNMALLLFQRGDYPGAWREVHLARGLGGTIGEAFLARLEAALPDPGR